MKHAKAIYGSSTTSKKEKTSSVPGGLTTASVEVVECIAETTSETASGGIKSFAEMGVVVANAAIGEANRGRPAGANASSCGSGSHIEQVRAQVRWRGKPRNYSVFLLLLQVSK